MPGPNKEMARVARNLIRENEDVRLTVKELEGHQHEHRAIASWQNPAPSCVSRRCSSNASGLPGRNSVRILGIRVSSAGVARASIPAEILAYAAYPKRCSSNANGLGGQTSAGFWKSVRPFKGIFCVDVSEFESYMPSQAVRSPPADIRA